MAGRCSHSRVRAATTPSSSTSEQGHTCGDWATVPCDVTAKEACGYSTEGFDAVLDACSLACGTCATSIGIHGDPIFKYGDSWLKFDLDPTYGLTPLLSWQEGGGVSGTSSTNTTYTIEASAKAHEHSNAEWLYAIDDLKVNGETTLLAKIGTPPHGNAAIRTMQVQLDGKELSS